MKRIALMLAAALTLSAFVIGCSSNDATAPKPPAQQQETPEYDISTVTLPSNMQTSQDPHAQMVVSYVTQINAFASYIGYMTPHSKAMLGTSYEFSGPPWIYTWTVNQGTENTYTVTLTIDEDTDSYTWRVELSGTFDGNTLTDFVFITAGEKKDGSSGYIDVYDPGTGQMALNLIWSHNSDGSYTYTYQIPQDVKIVATVHPDDSGAGSLFVYGWSSTKGDWVLAFRATWTASGSGTWWTYDSEGNVTDQGTWSS